MSTLSTSRASVKPTCMPPLPGSYGFGHPLMSLIIGPAEETVGVVVAVTTGVGVPVKVLTAMVRVRVMVLVGVTVRVAVIVLVGVIVAEFTAVGDSVCVGGVPVMVGVADAHDRQPGMSPRS